MNSPLKEFRPESLCLLKETQEDYWCYARRGPQDFSVYTEKSSIYETPRKEKFRESAEVLVRWTDGLFYLATIIQVEEEYNRCAVKFEDGSQFWALYKDIYKGSSPDDFSCTMCDSSSSQPPDEIVICDKCSLGYHQLCHIPKIDAADLNPDLPWSCRKCVFANAIKKGGAVKKGPNAQMMLLMKQYLPYDLQALTWDSTHKSNLQQTYCYCGGPGEWHSKMLQCTRCKQWFHEACLQCLEEPLLFGDRFYIFVCSVCNKGPEFLRRLPIRWPDIAHLVLFNLTIIHGKKFFEFDTSVTNFLKDNWSQFQIKGESVSRLTPEEKKKKLLEHLQNCKSRFTSGKEMKKKTTIWGLRSRMPPPVPSISLPETGVITNEVLDSFNAASRRSKPVVVKSIKTPVLAKRPRRTSVRESDATSSETSSKSAVSKQVKSSVQPASQEKPKRLSHLAKKKEKRKMPHRLAKCPKPSGTKRVHRIPPCSLDMLDSDDTCSSHGTLNDFIPPPTNFEGSNNPFQSNYQSSSKSESSDSPPTPPPTPRTEPKTARPSAEPKPSIRVRPSRKCTIRNLSNSVVNNLLNVSNLDCKGMASTPSSSLATSSSAAADLSSSVSQFFGVADRIANGEKYSVLAKRVAPDGKVQYLVEWDGLPPS